MMRRVLVLIGFIFIVIQLQVMPTPSILGMSLSIHWMMLVVTYLALFDRIGEGWDDRLLYVMGMGVWADSLSVAPFGYHLFVLILTYLVMYHGIVAMMVQSGRSKWLWVLASMGLYDLIDAIGHWMFMGEIVRVRFIFSHMWIPLGLTTLVAMVILPLIKRMCVKRSLTYSKSPRTVIS